ncbi:hypothetical protein H6G89_16865 [Oscillatoria sp. FACHB-1407]|uniref:hypothetical protein n=1 Tax=Oscillatoria sp. FACHB-1407 TaxID=2692847 RepID=UPI001685CA72|nr:hypothetical protein [Oscillatoria sp. FACHB-1407]MBD2462713.1 hypothetical protein [Oscillatoria sp. FACHB-1407]
MIQTLKPAPVKLSRCIEFVAFAVQQDGAQRRSTGLGGVEAMPHPLSNAEFKTDELWLYPTCNEIQKICDHLSEEI